jgi:hypothetical protein
MAIERTPTTEETAVNQVINHYPVRFPLVAGVLIRGDIRRIMAELGIEYTERKGLVDSHFMVTITSAEQGRAYQKLILKRYAPQDGSQN